MSKEEPLAFGALLRRLRLAAGLTQEELAERAQLSERAIRRLEHDPDRTPRLQTVRLLAQALDFAAEEQSHLLVPARPVPGAGDSSTVLRDAVAGALAVGRTLLMLDNMEHLLAARDTILNLLASCPDLHVFITSREALHVRGERIYTLGPLLLPERDADILRSPAVRLFLDWARDAGVEVAMERPIAEAVAELCRRLGAGTLAPGFAGSTHRATVVSRARVAGCAGSPADYAQYDRLELCPAHAGGAGPPCGAERLLRRLHPGGSGGPLGHAPRPRSARGGQFPGRAEPDRTARSGRAAIYPARDHPGRCGREA